MQKFMKRFVALLLVLTLLLTLPVANAATHSPNAVSLQKAKVTLTKNHDVYNGEIHDFSEYVTVTLNGEVLERDVDYVIYEAETSGSSAKVYSVSFIVVGIGHYKNYIQKTVKYTIDKADQQLVGVPESETFTILNKELKDGSKTLDFKITSSVGNTVTSTCSQNSKIKINSAGQIVIPKGTALGTYSVKVYGKSSTNYNATSKRTITIKIVKEDQSLVFSPDLNKTKFDVYAAALGSAAYTLPYTITTDSGRSVKSSCSANSAIKLVGGQIVVPKGTKAGTYKVKVYSSSSTYYNAAPSMYFTINVLKYDQTITAEETSYTVSYSTLKKKAQKLTIDGIEGNVKSLVWTSKNSKVKVTSAGVVTLSKGLAKGTYKITVYAKSSSYYNQSNTKTITITVK